MITPQINRRRRAPLWAILGLPAFGVPLVVALLAWAAPERKAEALPCEVEPAIEHLHLPGSEDVA